MFARGGFTLYKWNCSNPDVLEQIPEELKESQALCMLPDDAGYTENPWSGMEHGHGPFPLEDREASSCC